MASYKPNTKKNLGIILITVIMAVIGITFLIIGYHNDVLNWMKTFGLITCILLAPLVLWILYNYVIKKIKEM